MEGDWPKILSTAEQMEEDADGWDYGDNEKWNRSKVMDALTAGR